MSINDLDDFDQQRDIEEALSTMVGCVVIGVIIYSLKQLFGDMV